MILKSYAPKPVYKEGDRKTERHFAWWPKRVADNLIWLQPYWQVYEMYRAPFFDPILYRTIYNVKQWKIISEHLTQP
ncbi:MAG: hypothetical protein ACTHMC_01300 [Pseudobacter sp.]|uniref:hypothetical protein n=1 Tax=Pseudobacter sp. TaxID=2045420 RepID=UPI003F7F8567